MTDTHQVTPQEFEEHLRNRITAIMLDGMVAHHRPGRIDAWERAADLLETAAEALAQHWRANADLWRDANADNEEDE